MLAKPMPTRSDNELSHAVATLETLLMQAYGSLELDEGRLRHIKRLRDPVTLHLIKIIHEFLLQTNVLAPYVERARIEDEPDAFVVLALAKASLAREDSRVLRQPPEAEAREGSASKETTFKAFVFTVIGGVLIAAVTSFLNTQEEIKARWAEEVYSGRREFLKETIGKLNDFQVNSQELKAEIRRVDVEDPLYRVARATLPEEKLRKLHREFKYLIGTLQAEPKSKLRFAELHSDYELEALGICLAELTSEVKNDQVGFAQQLAKSKSALVANIREDGKSQITEEEALIILNDADVNPPCGKKFQLESFEELTYQVAKEMWSLGEDKD